jgi:hypothetical protein
MKDLSEEQKQHVSGKVELYRWMCLDSFSMPRGGKAIQEWNFPRPLLQGETTMAAANIHHLVNEPVHHAFIKQFVVWVNTL